MAQKKQTTRKTKSTTKTQSTARKRPAKRRTSKRRGVKLPDLILIVLLVTLISVQTIKWIDQRQEPARIERESPQQTKTDFIKQLVPSAQKQQRQYHVFASITLAQAALESNWGQSELSARYHNLFGIKSDQPNSPQLTTKEYVNGQWITVKARFASYASYDESIAAHTQLFVNGTGWDASHYQAVLAAANYQQAAQALQAKGYATDPGYAQKLIDLIQEYHLDQYD